MILASIFLGALYIWIGDALAQTVRRRFFDGHLDLPWYFIVMLLWPVVLPLLAIACIVAFVRIIVGKISK